MLKIVFRGKIIKLFMLYIYCKLSLYIYVNRILIIIFNIINLILVCLCIINSKAVYKNLLTILNLYINHYILILAWLAIILFAIIHVPPISFVAGILQVVTLSLISLWWRSWGELNFWCSHICIGILSQWQDQEVSLRC